MNDKAAELDLMTDQQAIISLETEFRGWMCFRHGQGIWLTSCFARRHSDGVQVEGEDWVDLRDQIRREIGRAQALCAAVLGLRDGLITRQSGVRAWESSKGGRPSPLRSGR